MKINIHFVFWIIIQILCSFIDSWFLLNFYHIYEKRKLKYFSYFLLCLFIFFTWSNFFEDFLIFMVFLKLFIVFLFSFILTKDSLLSLIGSILVYIVPLIMDNFYGLFWSLYFDKFDVEINFFIDNLFFLLIMSITFFLYKIILNYWIPSKESKNFILFLGLPLLALLSTHNFVTITKADENGFFLQSMKSIIDKKQVFGITFFSILFLFGILFFNKRLIDYIEKEKQYFLLQKKLEHMKEIQICYDKTKSLRHDYKNHILVLSALLKNEKNQEAEKYIENLESAVDQLNASIFTGNAVLDVLLKEKLFIARQRNISITYDIIIPPHFFVNEMDFNILFSNALDNAITACEYVEEKNRFIEIFAKKKKDFFIIKIKNSRNENFEKPEGQGIFNIRTIVKKYYGIIHINKEKESFCLEILLFFSQQ